LGSEGFTLSLCPETTVTPMSNINKVIPLMGDFTPLLVAFMVNTFKFLVFISVLQVLIFILLAKVFITMMPNYFSRIPS
jgi:hypothetical protein